MHGQVRQAYGTRIRSGRGPGADRRAMPALALETGSDATTYTDTDVAANTKYVYRVRAINEAGVGRRSGRVEITTRE